MLTYIGALVNILLAYVYVFPIGYVLWHLKKIPQFNSVPFIIRTPAYLTMGFAALSLVLGIVGRVILNGTIARVFFVCSWVLMFALVFRKSNLRVIKKWSRIRLRQRIHNVVSLTLFGVIVSYFCTAVNQLKWPVPGDAMFIGLTVSLIQYHQKIPSTYAPIAPLESNIYPSGFHAVSALLSSFMQYGYYPGEVILVTAALITALIPCMLYFVTYMKTRAITFSLLPFLSFFLLHPSGNRERSILGLFVNGTYPPLMGLLLMLAFVSLIHFRDSSKDALGLDPVHFLILVFILVGAIFVVYYPFLVYISIYLLVYIISNWKLVAQRIRQMKPPRNSLLGSRFAIFMVLLAIICVLLLGLIAIFHLISTIQSIFLYHGAEVYGFYLGERSMYDYLNGFMILLMSPVVVMLLIIKERKEVQTNLFYLCLFVPIMIALDKDLFNRFFHIFLPSRSTMLLASLAWIIFARSLHIIFSLHHRFSGVSRKIRSFQKFSVLCVTLILFLLFSSQLSTALKFYRNEGFIITGRRTFWSFSPCEGSTTESIDCHHPADYESPDDYLAAMWIDQNIPAEDLILNDLSWASLYLLSFSVKNVVFNLLGYVERTKDCIVIWEQPEHPMHEQILINRIEKYEIRYLWVTAELGYFDWWFLGGDDGYKAKTKRPLVYGEIFDKYHFLTPVFQSGDSKIYKITLVTP